MNPAILARQQSRVGEYTLTRHAISRMLEFGVTRQGVEELLKHFECRYNQSDRGPDVFVYQLGEWACVADDRDKTVITILRRQVQRWEH